MGEDFSSAEIRINPAAAPDLHPADRQRVNNTILNHPKIRKTTHLTISTGSCFGDLPIQKTLTPKTHQSPETTRSYAPHNPHPKPPSTHLTQQSPAPYPD